MPKLPHAVDRIVVGGDGSDDLIDEHRQPFLDQLHQEILGTLEVLVERGAPDTDFGGDIGVGRLPEPVCGK